MMDDRETGQWVEERMLSLNTEGDEGMINGTRILAKLQAREFERRKVQTRLIGGAIFAVAACGAAAGVIAVESGQRVEMEPLRAVRVGQAPTVPAIPNMLAPRRPEQTLIAANENPPRVAERVEAVPVSKNFKEHGSAAAAIEMDIYFDPECPPCATFYNDALPGIFAEYVATGKVKAVYRDFPLPYHQYAALAARYENAAGIIGRYDAVVDRLMKTQQLWHASGDVEAEVAAVLTPEEMQRLHRVLDATAEPDEMIARDGARAADDHINQTPSIVVEAGGRRVKFAGVNAMQELKAHLNELLGQ